MITHSKTPSYFGRRPFRRAPGDVVRGLPSKRDFLDLTAPHDVGGIEVEVLRNVMRNYLGDGTTQSNYGDRSKDRLERIKLVRMHHSPAK